METEVLADLASERFYRRFSWI